MPALGSIITSDIESQDIESYLCPACNTVKPSTAYKKIYTSKGYYRVKTHCQYCPTLVKTTVEKNPTVKILKHQITTLEERVNKLQSIISSLVTTLKASESPLEPRLEDLQSQLTGQ